MGSGVYDDLLRLVPLAEEQRAAEGVRRERQAGRIAKQRFSWVPWTNAAA